MIKVPMRHTREEEALRRIMAERREVVRNRDCFSIGSVLPDGRRVPRGEMEPYLLGELSAGGWRYDYYMDRSGRIWYESGPSGGRREAWYGSVFPNFDGRAKAEELAEWREKIRALAARSCGKETA